MLVTGLTYILIPTLFIIVLAFKRHSTKLKWLLTTMLFGLVILFFWIIARWEIPSIYFKFTFPALYIVASIISYKRIQKSEKSVSRIVSILELGINIFLIFFFCVMNFLALRGYSVPENTIDLHSPFKEGKYIVLHGGSRPMVNAHFHVTPQNYAVDIVGLNTLGMRASSIGGGSNLNDYVIFGKPVYSPCKGKVILIKDEFEDLIPPLADPKNPAGNYVLIGYEGNEILLAHLKKGSIKVKVGDTVDTNTIIGQVGNTGNTSEPHLHMHAEYGGTPETILDGKGMPFKINDKFLVRGDILDN